MRLKAVLAFLISIFCGTQAFALDAPTITATAISYNQIDLTWAAVSNPGWGYKVEIQSDSDSRYSTWTDYTATLRNGFGYLPYWVTDGHYLDRANGSGTLTPATDACIDHSEACGTHAQLMVFGLKYSTLYSFRVRSYGKTDAGVDTYSSYSSTASATTATPGTIRHVKQGGAGDGTSEVNAWGALSSANGVSAGTLVIVHGGTLAANSFNPSNSGTKTSRIVIQADPGETAIITAPAGSMIVLDTNYVTVDGLTLTNTEGNTSSEVVYFTGQRNIIANTTLEGPAPTYEGNAPVETGGYNLFENNYWKEFGSMDGSSGSCLRISGNYTMMSNTHHEKGGHDTLIIRGSRVAVLNSVFDGGWGIGIEIQGNPTSLYNLIEGSIIKEVTSGGSPWGGSYKPGIEVSAQYNTLRRNIIRDNYDYGIEVSDVLQDATHNLIYNNTVYHNQQSGLYFPNGTVTNNEVANNIFYYNAEAYTEYGCSYPNSVWYPSADSTFHHNQVLYKSGAVESTTNNKHLSCPANDCYTLAQWEAAAPTVAYSNITTTPSFVDEGNNIFQLKSTSGLIAQGTSITDTYWGTTGETDIGAFKYYAITGGSTTTTLTGGTIQGGSMQ